MTFRPKSSLESLNCAIEGIIYAVKTQKHIRYHFALTIIALLLGVILNLPALEFILLIFAFIILLFAEMLNTAVEITIDMMIEEFHPLARAAKDVAAGAVLLSSFGIFIMCYVIFIGYLHEPLAVTLGKVREFTGYLAFLSLIVVFVGVIVSKAHFGKGTPLRGGMPSGHSAIAFSLWVSLTLMTLNPLVTILTFILALMVSHSRLITRIHSTLEIFLGAMLGIGTTLLMFFLFS